MNQIELVLAIMDIVLTSQWEEWIMPSFMRVVQK